MMQNEKITFDEFRDEVADMFTTCFEGEAVLCGNVLKFTFANGQKFLVIMQEET